MTQNELLLYNLLATASTLVYRSARVFSGKIHEQPELECDIEQWFSEAKKVLSAASFQATGKATATSAPDAGRYGGPWNSPTGGFTPASPGPVKSTETLLTEGGHSSPPSSGGIAPPAEAGNPLSETSAGMLWFMR